ncbi:GntR family transcriptional regulator [Spirochaeta cellobiosiphila]|uniref:GntR family transcriptional regulator n=1 Tax=Spirochaeta cellobiosiphila TaxID=504483 RepID=UPI000403B048|nr:GntR family transcriptional regulator [Spirochaeta cellobiosiphila]
MSSRRDQIKKDILLSLQSGKYPDNKLPSELEMAKRFQVSRMTYRTIAKELAEEGHLVVIHGVGTFLSQPLPSIPGSLDQLESLGSMIQNSGFKESESINLISSLFAKEDMARKLDIALGSELVYMERTRLADGSSIAFSQNYLPKSLVGDIFGEGQFSGSLLSYIENKAHIKIVCADTEIALPNPEQQSKACEHLGKDTGVFLLKQIHYDEFNLPILYSHDYLREDVFQFRLRRRRS